MLATVGAARSALVPDALNSVREFLSSTQHRCGGFRGRTSEPDIYYTVFGLECCLALDAPFDRDRAIAYVNGVTDLDLVHHCCCIRCARRLGLLSDAPARVKSLRSRLTKLVATSMVSGRDEGVQAAFLAALAYEDLGGVIPNRKTVLRLLARYERPDGSFANVDSAGSGLVTATAAAVVIRYRLTGARPKKSLNWLRSQYVERGGFRVGAAAPCPDLLSTATALFALHACGEPLAEIADSCEAFIADLWQPCGGFAGHMGDRVADCEYTYYGLLGLGSLA